MARRHTEESLLTSYLLPPSSLPTIVPLSTFLNYHKPGASSATSSTIKPATARALKKFYRDLQFQRQIDVDTVRLNIERECKRGRILKARLSNSVKAELRDGGHRVESPRGRKRKHALLEDDEAEEEPESDNENAGDGNGAGRTDVDQPSYTALTDAREMVLDAQFFGPNGTVLPTRSRRYHTTTSLLEAMEASAHDLEREIAELDAQSDQVMTEMHGIVGSLGDLRYGTSYSQAGGGGGADSGDGTSLEAKVADALNEFTTAVNRTVKRGRGETGR